MNQVPDKQIKIKELAAMQKALADPPSLKRHLEAYSIDAQEENTGYTLLHLAVQQFSQSSKPSQKNRVSIIESLIIQGASPYIKDKKGQRAIESKNFQNSVKKILKTHKPNSSKKIYYVYLAGPEVFLTFNQAAGQFIKAQTRLFSVYHLSSAPYSMEGLYPFDSGYTPKNMDFQDGVKIYNGDVDLMNKSHAIVANMVKFRGPGMDGGTAYEMGYMTAQGKIIVGYYDERPYFDNCQMNRPYTQKVKEDVGELAKKGPYGLTYDKDNLLVEPFQMPDNLMMVVPTLDSKGQLNISASSWEALFVLKDKLAALQKSP